MTHTGGVLPLTRRHRPPRPVAVGAVLSIFRRGGGDPTLRAGSGSWWLARRTPAGPGTLALVSRAALGEVEAHAWGAGGEWLLDSLPGLLGDEDDDSGFVAHHPRVAEARARYAAWRVPKSRLVIEALVPAIIEQRVTGKEAFSAYRRLVRRFGEPAPGRGAELGLHVAPDAAGWAAIPSWEWLRVGVEGARADTVMRSVGVAGRLEQTVDLPPLEALRRLRSIPGVGVWTAAEVAQRALGYADAPSFGDYHVAKDITWALTGAPSDDAALERLLAPYAGHRYRVQRLLELDGAHRPRRAPRMTLPTHLPTR